MRVSTNQIFDSGASVILRNQASLAKIQNQISTGRRNLTPSDDPVASSLALLTTQAREVNAQYGENQKAASSQLGLLESQLQSVGDLLQNVRERVIQLGNAALSDKDRGAIAAELKQRFSELMGLANSRNAEGHYLFSGFQGAVTPFSVSSPLGTAPFSAGTAAVASQNPYVTYSGDDGERLMQVESTRQLSVSASGAEVFMRIAQGNGSFVTAEAGKVASLPAFVNNSGSGVADQGSVVDLAKWNAATTQPQDYRVVFKVDSGGTLKYTLTDASSAVSLYDNGALDPTGTSAVQWKVFVPGQAISFTGLDPSVVVGGDLGVQLSVSGRPADGDSFSVKASQNQSIFDTLQNAIAAASAATPAGTSGNTVLANRVISAVANIDQSLDNVLRVRASVGSRLAELESLANTGSQKNIEYEQHLSELQDLDYASAITELNKQQVQLEAAQKSFARITSLSLFDIL